MNWFRFILKGMASIMEGMATFTLFPPKQRRKFKVPSLKNGFETDAENLRKDYETLKEDGI